MKPQIEKLEQARDNGEAIDPDQVQCIYNITNSIKCTPCDIVCSHLYTMKDHVMCVDHFMFMLYFVQARKIQRKGDVIEQLEYLKPLNLLTSSLS